MACVRSKKTKLGKMTYSIIMQKEGREYQIASMGDKRQTERFCGHLDCLRAYHGVLTAELIAWADTLDDKLYNKLAEMGLLSARPKKHTLGDLLASYTDRSDVTRSTLANWKKVSTNLVDFFGADCDLTHITLETAERFCRWIRAAKLNRRKLSPERYALPTASKRIKETWSIFHYAVMLGWIPQSPFQFQKGGADDNPDTLVYIPVEDVLKMLEGAPPRWAAILVLGRFCGVRGSSEMFNMRWENVHWSSPGEPGSLLIRSFKNKRHGRRYRLVPLPPIAEKYLSIWWGNLPENQPYIFPGMKSHTTLTEIGKLFLKVGLVPPVKPWYNMRKSCCSDWLEGNTDIFAYEKMSDHGINVARNHYQIMHKGRKLRNLRAAGSVFDRIPTDFKLKNGDSLESVKTRLESTQSTPEKSPSKVPSETVQNPVRCFAYDIAVLQEVPQVLIEC